MSTDEEIDKEDVRYMCVYIYTYIYIHNVYGIEWNLCYLVTESCPILWQPCEL